MMSVDEYLLVCLAEECAEISHRAGKALRFGLDVTDPTIPGAPTERVRIKEEITDLIAVVAMLVDYGFLPAGIDYDAAAAKKSKVTKFMAYAREGGALE